MTCLTCPIVWKKEDGRYPCAFLRNGNECRSPLNDVCIPLHKKKYLRAVSLVPGGNKCPGCDNLVNITYEQLERHHIPYCKKCSETLNEFASLAAHIRGDY